MRIERTKHDHVISLGGRAQERPRVAGNARHARVFIRRSRMLLSERHDNGIDLDRIHLKRAVTEGPSRVIAGPRTEDEDSLGTPQKIRQAIFIASFCVTCEIYRLLMKKPVDVQLERPV